MKKTLLITIAVIALLALYKKQHVKPIDDPKDSPIFQQRLKSSLERFQVDEFQQKQQETRAGQKISMPPSPSPRSSAYTRELMVTGMCGTVTLTWAEEKALEKESIRIKRKTQGQDYTVITTGMIYDQAVENGMRYWASESGLSDSTTYEYLISFKDAQGKEVTRGPVSLTLTCTEKDRELIAQREKMIKDYYQKQGIPSSSSPSLSPAATKVLFITGRCSAVTLTWAEEKAIEKETIRIKRKAQGQDYTVITTGMIYDQAVENGVRYWASDNGLGDDTTYEYLISLKDAQGKEVTRGPASFTLTCTEKDREFLAQREKMIKEYYQKKGIEIKDSARVTPPTYQLSKEVYKVEVGNSPQKGRRDAPVTLIVFSDFECVHCSTWAQTLESLQNTFPNKVKVVFKNYPIPYHQKAQPAAMAALAAGEQGKFWEMHDLLYKNPNALGYENFLGYAKTLGLEELKFQKALESAKLKSLIEQDQAQGKTLGVQNIPTTFINGRSLVGSPPVSYIKNIIEELIKR